MTQHKPLSNRGLPRPPVETLVHPTSFTTRALNPPTMANPLQGVEAYVFDVFGTVVDWRGSVTRALADFAGSEDEGQYGADRI